jgi:hypothetical protein
MHLHDANTWRAYRNDLKEFMILAGVRAPIERASSPEPTWSPG